MRLSSRLGGARLGRQASAPTAYKRLYDQLLSMAALVAELVDGSILRLKIAGSIPMGGGGALVSRLSSLVSRLSLTC